MIHINHPRSVYAAYPPFAHSSSFVTIHLQKVIRATGDTLLNGALDGTLREDRSLTVASCAVLEALAHITNIDKTLLEEFVRDDKVPCRASGKKPFAIICGDDAVRGGFVGVVLEDVGVKFGRVKAHRAGGRLRRDGAMADVRGGTQNLVLSRHLLEVSLQTFVLERRLLLCRLKTREFSLKVLDMLLFPLTESTLSGRKKC